MKSEKLPAMEFAIPQYNLEHNRPIVGYGNFSKEYQGDDAICQLDDTIVQQKFDMWDKVQSLKLLTKFHDKKGNLLKHVTKEDYRTYLQAVLLLKDKTIFAYSRFKFDHIPFKLRFYQDVLLSDTHDRILFGASNQIGKSLALDADAAIQFLTDHNKNYVGILVSKSLGQSQYQMDRIKSLLKSASIDYRVESTTDKNTGKKDNQEKITYTFYEKDPKTGKDIEKYTNLLICCPPTGSALGFPCDDMWLDEFDFWKDVDQHNFIYQIAIPRTYDTNGRIKIFTNPDGKGKMLWHLWNEKDEDGNYVWHRYNFNYWDKPGATQKDFNKKSQGQTRQQTESTLLAMFSTSSMSFLSYKEINDQLDSSLNDASGYSRETAWFLDVGHVHDQSVLTGGFIEENPLSEDLPIIKAFYIHKYPVGYPLPRVIGLERLRDLLSEEQLKVMKLDVEEDGWEDYADDNPSVASVLDRYAHVEADGKGSLKKYFPVYGYDVTGNQGLIPLHDVLDIDSVDITFSGPKKFHMYTRYKAWTQQRWFKRAKDRDDNTVNGKDFAYQASKLIEKKAPGRNYSTIHHENEDDYDDTQDSVAGMIHLIDNPDYPNLSFDIISNGESMLAEIDKEKAEIAEGNKKIEQYIPNFVDKNELSEWQDRKLE